ncbi:MAG: PQQ-dependent sugar dehydrogenase [Chloroflexi bacterium]|nr:PQQ-dependent sugar dehydrogenase [Chloroflexota bacterium]MYD47831.1 PQQ-dependent sugar dehydrogenase [Chloroflexota bacterium]
MALAMGCSNEAGASIVEPNFPAPSPTAETGNLRLLPALTARQFRDPTNLVQAKSGQALVAEQAGRIWVSSGLRPDNVAVSEFLDITDRVNSRGSEEGLLGMALDPKNQRHMYVYYSAANPRRSVVSRFTVSADLSDADPDSELVILEVGQPYANHNGGQLAFGPDGYLYVGLGDGGSAGDPRGNGQDTSTLLGSILRIDVSPATAERRYAIPADNPFANGGGRGDIWAYGLRNPWRFSFDRDTGELWAGDVGQNRWEEIDLIRRGGNYGWNVLEGNHCFRPSNNCSREGMTPPVWEYSLDGEPCSVIGGYVYRGSAIPWLKGAYVYGDFCSGKVYGLRYVDDEVVEHRRLADTGLRIMSFAQDSDGELYLLTRKSGIYRLSN